MEKLSNMEISFLETLEMINNLSPIITLMICWVSLFINIYHFTTGCLLTLVKLPNT